MSSPNNWFAKTNTGEILGPYSEPQIREALCQGSLEAGSLIRQGNSRWFTLAELTEVFTRLAESGWYLAEANGDVNGPFTVPRLKSLLTGCDCSQLHVCQGTAGNWMLATQWLESQMRQPLVQPVAANVVSQPLNIPKMQKSQKSQKGLVAVIVGVVMTVGGGLFMILVALIAAMVKNPAKVYNAYQMQERRQQAEPVAYTVGQDGTKIPNRNVTVLLPGETLATRKTYDQMTDAERAWFMEQPAGPLEFPDPRGNYVPRNAWELARMQQAQWQMEQAMNNFQAEIDPAMQAVHEQTERNKQYWKEVLDSGGGISSPHRQELK